MAAASPFGELLREDLRGEGGASNLAFNEKVTARNLFNNHAFRGSLTTR